MTAAPTFATWLRAQLHRDDPTGDLARDAVGDVSAACLRRITSPEALRRHITEAHYIDPSALAALDRAAEEWQEMTA